MKGETSPSSEKGQPGRLRLADLIGKRVELRAGDGALLYARHLSTGDLHDLRSLIDDPVMTDEALGREVVRRLISRSKDAFDQPLAEAEVGSIAPVDELAGAVAKAIGVVLRPDGGDAVAQIGANALQQARDSAETARRVRESFGSIGSTLQSQMAKSLDAMKVAARNLSSMADPSAALAHRDPKMFEVGSPVLADIGPSPLIRSSELTVEKLDWIATQLAALASSEAELLRTVTLDVVPKWEEASKASDSASKRALMLARWSIGIALVALLASAVVPYHIQARQDAAAAADRAVDVEARARQEALMRDQLGAVHALRAQLKQQAAPATPSTSSSTSDVKPNAAATGR